MKVDKFDNEDSKQLNVSNFNTGEVSVSNLDINTDNNTSIELGELSSKHDLIK